MNLYAKNNKKHRHFNEICTLCLKSLIRLLLMKSDVLMTLMLNACGFHFVCVTYSSTLKQETIRFSRKSVNSRQIARHHISEDKTLYLLLVY
jgi:hypothetical protein